MAKSGPKVLHAPEPPAQLSTLALSLAATPTEWWRLSLQKYPSCLYWSRSGEYRFDSPGAKWGVCYAAGSLESATQEVWGDTIRRAGRLDWNEVANTTAWKVVVSPNLKTIELAGRTLTVIRATLQSFVASYPVSQRWGAALMDHPADLDGLQYIGRRCGRTCLALFGDLKAPKAHQASLREVRQGLLSEWSGLWPFLNSIDVRIMNLPRTVPPATW